MKIETLSLFIVFLVFLAPAVLAAGTGVCRWEGNISINGSSAGSLITGNSTHLVTSYTNSTLEKNGTAYNSGEPRYIINVPGNNSYSNVTFHVCGIYDSTAGERTWDCSASWNSLDLTMTYQIAGASCTQDCACNQSANLHCGVDYDGAGAWCIASGYCMHDTSSTANGGTLCSGSTLYTCTNGDWVTSTCTYPCSGNSCGSAPTTGVSPGGGGGVTVTSESISVGSASAGQTVTAKYTKSADLKIQEINVTLKASVTSASIEVKESSLPSGASAPVTAAEGSIYKYLEVIRTRMDDAAIESAVIKFKVAVSWIASNNIDKSTIALFRYNSTTKSWTKYPATIISEDTSYIYYSVEVPGLSVFAITGEKAPEEAVCTPNAKACVGDELQQCTADGMNWSVLEACEYGCDPVNLVCRAAPAPECTAGEKRCFRNNLQECSEEGVWETLESCTYGCDPVNLVCRAAVPAPECTAGEKKCVGNELQQCKSDGSGWETLETCTYGCDEDAKECKPPEFPWIPVIVAIVIIIALVIVVIAYSRKGRPA